MDNRWWWRAAGLAAGIAGLAASDLAAAALTIRSAPIVAVAEIIIRYTPGVLIERAIRLLGHFDKPVLVLTIVLVIGSLFALAGDVARRTFAGATAVWVALASIGAAAVLANPGTGRDDLAPIGIGLATWLVVHRVLIAMLRRAVRLGPDHALASRRRFLIALGVVGAGALATTVAGRMVTASRRQIATTRRLLRIDGVTSRGVPARTLVGVEGVTPWQTPNEDFYVIDTTLRVPVIDPKEWRLRIHGMVERELTLSFDDLLLRELTEAWVTLACVSNQIGGKLVGNAWWSGVRIGDLLKEAGVLAGADCVLQTSHDGWTCATPLAALTDQRNALLAVAMNGHPLPLEHGFPVRAVVPGLYGYVSATKWLVDLQVSRFDEVMGYWTDKGWAELGPMKLASRIDTPTPDATVPPGPLAIGGVAWQTGVGIDSVEISLDGGVWQPTTLAWAPSVDTWVQWSVTVDVAVGEHEVRVRARGKDGTEQTGVRRAPDPDGATGWHTVAFSAEVTG